MHLAIENGVNVYNDENSSQIEVDYAKAAWNVYNDSNALDEVSINEAINKLTIAKAKLVLKQLDKSRLEYLIGIIEKALNNPDKYKQDEAWNKCVAKLAEAKEILANGTSQEAIDKIVNELSDVYSNLRIKPDENIIKDLKKFLEETKELDFNKYSLLSQRKIKDAILAAKEVINNPDVSQEELITALSLVKEAREIISNPDAGDKEVSAITGDNQNMAVVWMGLMGSALVAIYMKKRKES